MINYLSLFILTLTFLTGAEISYFPEHVVSGDLLIVKLKLNADEKYLEVLGNGLAVPIYPWPSSGISEAFASSPNTSRSTVFFAKAFDVENPFNEVRFDVRLSRSNVLLKIPVEVRRAPLIPTGRVDLSDQTKSQVLSDPGKIYLENLFFQRFYETNITTNLFWRGAFGLPVSEPTITSVYGKLRVYNNGTTSFHRGIDFGLGEGTPVFAVGRGVVCFAGKTIVRGNMITIDHGGRLFTGYWHLSKIEVAVGDSVTYNEKIGEIGATGLVTGPHLHFEARLGSVVFNGLSLFALSNFIQN